MNPEEQSSENEEIPIGREEKKTNPNEDTVEFPPGYLEKKIESLKQQIESAESFDELRDALKDYGEVSGLIGKIEKTNAEVKDFERIKNMEDPVAALKNVIKNRFTGNRDNKLNLYNEALNEALVNKVTKLLLSRE